MPKKMWKDIAYFVPLLQTLSPSETIFPKSDVATECVWILTHIAVAVLLRSQLWWSDYAACSSCGIFCIACMHLQLVSLHGNMHATRQFPVKTRYGHYQLSK